MVLPLALILSNALAFSVAIVEPATLQNLLSIRDRLTHLRHVIGAGGAREDGIHDSSCARALAARLRRQGYPLEADVELVGGRRSLASHLWMDAYTPIVLEFFARHAR